MSPSEFEFLINPLKPNDPYRGRTAPLNSKVAFYIFIQQIQVLNIFNIVCTLCFFHLQIAVCFIILTYLVSVLFTFYIQVFLLFYIFIQQIQVLNIFNTVYTACLFPFKMQFISSF